VTTVNAPWISWSVRRHGLRDERGLCRRGEPGQPQEDHAAGHAPPTEKYQLAEVLSDVTRTGALPAANSKTRRRRRQVPFSAMDSTSCPSARSVPRCTGSPLVRRPATINTASAGGCATLGFHRFGRERQRGQDGPRRQSGMRIEYLVHGLTGGHFSRISLHCDSVCPESRLPHSPLVANTYSAVFISVSPPRCVRCSCRISAATNPQIRLKHKSTSPRAYICSRPGGRESTCRVESGTRKLVVLPYPKDPERIAAPASPLDPSISSGVRRQGAL